MPDPDRKRRIGQLMAHHEALRELLGKKNKRSISPATGFALLEDEVTETRKSIDELKKVVVENARAPQASHPEMSLRAPGGFRVHLSAVPPWVVVVALLTAVAVVWLVAR